MILIDAQELLTLSDDNAANNLHMISLMNADFKILTNFHMYSIVAICNIGRDFDWIKCKKTKK